MEKVWFYPPKVKIFITYDPNLFPYAWMFVHNCQKLDTMLIQPLLLVLNHFKLRGHKPPPFYYAYGFCGSGVQKGPQCLCPLLRDSKAVMWLNGGGLESSKGFSLTHLEVDASCSAGTQLGLLAKHLKAVSPCCSSSFSTACWLGPKGKHCKRTRWMYRYIYEWLEKSLSLYAIGWGRAKA